MANEKELFVQGHAFESYPLVEAHPGHGFFQNIRQAYLRYTPQVKPMAAIQVRYNGQVEQTTADERGFFRECLSVGEKLEPGWHSYQYRFPDRIGWQTSEFYVASEEKTGVISDIDDTVLISHSTKAFRKFFLILLRNAFTRDPFPFMKRWFEDLKSYNDGQAPSDYFYVSDSEWNLYDFLVDFFQIHGIPKGVFLLKELRKGISELLFGRSVKPTSKLERIRFLFDFYDRKPFILVGDSGQKDMEVYARVVEGYPDRVKAVMIRDLPRIRDEAKIRQYRNVFKEKKVPFVTFSDDNSSLRAE